MYLSYLQLTAITVLSFLLGGLLTYFLTKQRIDLLKDSVYSLNASLQGLWNINEKWQEKYAALEKRKIGGPAAKNKNQVTPQHATDKNLEQKKTSI
ncbi:MAG: hypothetical protein AAF960_19370 [Bacteroidota bacterium]